MFKLAKQLVFWGVFVYFVAVVMEFPGVINFLGLTLGLFICYHARIHTVRQDWIVFRERKAIDYEHEQL